MRILTKGKKKNQISCEISITLTSTKAVMLLLLKYIRILLLMIFLKLHANFGLVNILKMASRYLII